MFCFALFSCSQFDAVKYYAAEVKCVTQRALTELIPIGCTHLSPFNQWHTLFGEVIHLMLLQHFICAAEFNVHVQRIPKTLQRDGNTWWACDKCRSSRRVRRCCFTSLKCWFPAEGLYWNKFPRWLSGGPGAKLAEMLVSRIPECTGPISCVLIGLTFSSSQPKALSSAFYSVEY